MGKQKDEQQKDEQDASAAEHLRMVEDQWLGADAPRTPDGKVERGHGSLLQRQSVERRRHHAAIEKAMDAEQECATAHAALQAAKAKLDAAYKDVENTWVK